MKTNLMKRLPLGTSSFAKLRGVGPIYVDKTDKVYDLASQVGNFFLARPRRFGKSLLISTFESLFKYGLRDFEGLKISKLWKDEKKYQVVRLDFSEIKNFSSIQKFNAELDSLLIGNFSSVGFSYTESKTILCSTQISTWLKTLPSCSLVLLIDEYDAPLSACLDEPKLFEKVRQKLSEFYSVIKANDAAFRFLFITGLTTFNKMTVFSDLNNLSDISLSPVFGSLLGYTHEEVQDYFSEYLSCASKKLGIEKEKLFKELTEHYDGFCFEETAKQKVFAPWSLLHFFFAPERGLKDYWLEGPGKPTVIVKFLNSHALRRAEDYDGGKSIALSTLSEPSDIENLSDVELLTQTGYLTLKRIQGTTVYVGYPNLEVRAAVAQLYQEQTLKEKLVDGTR